MTEPKEESPKEVGYPAAHHTHGTQPIRQLTSEENNSIAACKKQSSKGIAPLFKAHVCAEGDKNKYPLDRNLKSNLDPDDAENEFDARLYRVSGSAAPKAGIDLITEVANIALPADADTERMVRQLNLTAAQMAEMEPQDPFEGQLIAQMLALHQLAMRYMRRLFKSETCHQASEAANIVSKLTTRYQEAFALLDKHRRGGEQRVHVKHVHISGGQTMLGNFQTGGGVQPKSEQRTP